MQMKTLLIVDDEPTNLRVLTRVLNEKFRVLAAVSGERALQIAAASPKPDLILLDVMMPEMDGYTVLSRLKQNPLTADIPVIFVTAMDADTDEKKGFELGAVDYITKPIRPEILIERVKSHLILKQARDFLRDKNDFLEAEIRRRMAENLLIQNVSIRALAHLAETRDNETGDHILRTQAYVEVLAEKLKNHPKFKQTLSDQYIDLVVRSAPLHDIGKVGIPDSVLLKAGPLTDEEWDIMRTHAVQGALAIEKSEKDMEQPVKFLLLAKEIARWHHERWDGKGYPDGLSGEQIPVSARLMAVADVFDALISDRVYKKAIPFGQARDIILLEQGKQFDPDITDAFMQCYQQFVAIAQKYQGNDRDTKQVAGSSLVM